MNLRLELNADAIVAEVTDPHPVDYDSATRILADLVLGLHRALAAADADAEG